MKKDNISAIYRDREGYIVVNLDEFGVSFKEGKAYFSDGENDYVIDADLLVSIG